MNNKNKKEPWRVIVFIISMLFIAFMWVKNDVICIYMHIAVPTGQQGRNSRPCRDIMGGHPQNAKFVRKQP